MPYRKIEEGFFDTAEQQLESIVGCFAEAVEQVCESETKGREALRLISRYISRDPYGDVLEETQSLFFRKELFGGEGGISREEFNQILQRIKNFYFILLPGYTLKDHSASFERFFSHIQEYAEM